MGAALKMGCSKNGDAAMPKLIPPLTDMQVRSVKPQDKPYKLSDGGRPIYR